MPFFVGGVVGGVMLSDRISARYVYALSASHGLGGNMGAMNSSQN